MESTILHTPIITNCVPPRLSASVFHCRCTETSKIIRNVDVFMHPFTNNFALESIALVRQSNF